MKKFFSLLVGAVLAASAVAVPNVQMQSPILPSNVSAKIKPEFKHVFEHQSLEALQNDANYKLVKAQKIASSANPSEEWDLYIHQFVLPWCDMLDFQDNQTGEIFNYPFEEIPIHYLKITLSRYVDGYVYDYIPYDMFWPCNACFDSRCWVRNASGSGYEVDWDAAEVAFGSLEEAQKIMPVDDVIKVMTNDNGEIEPIYFVAMYNISYIGVANPEFSNNVVYWHGNKYGIIGPDGNDTSKSSWIKILDYNAGTNYFEFDTYVGMGAFNSDIENVGTVRYKLNSNFNGTDGLIRGFGPEQYNLGEIHIFNVGLFDENNDDFLDVPATSKPTYRYFIAGCHPDYTFDHTYEATKLPELVYRKDSGVAYNSNNYNAFWGYLYAAPDAKDPYGIYTMPEYKFDSKGVNITPVEPGTCFSPLSLQQPNSEAITNFAESFGIKNIYGSYTAAMLENKTKFGIGDKEKGLNAQWIDFAGGNVVLLNYTGDIIYHNNPNDYTEITTLPAIGNVDANVQTVSASSAVESVVSDSPVVGVEYYNIQGIRMNNAPEKGLYIKRELKADGSAKASKVIR